MRIDLRATTLALAVAFLVAVCVPFALLVQHFGYDDVLREPPGVILQRFHDGGPGLVLIWAAFALGCLAFIPLALVMERSLRPATHMVSWVAVVGIASALLQACGLLRWVFVVPAIADTWASAAEDPTRRAMAELAFGVVHQYGGVVIGEFLGQVFLVAWTLGTCALLARAGGAMRSLALVGVAICAGWVLGFSELLAPVVPGMPSIEAAPIAFMSWEVWLLAVALALVLRPAGAPARSGA